MEVPRNTKNAAAIPSGNPTSRDLSEVNEITIFRYLHPHGYCTIISLSHTHTQEYYPATK